MFKLKFILELKLNINILIKKKIGLWFVMWKLFFIYFCLAKAKCAPTQRGTFINNFL